MIYLHLFAILNYNFIHSGKAKYLTHILMLIQLLVSYSAYVLYFVIGMIVFVAE